MLVKSLSIVALLYTDKSRFSCCYSPIVAPPKFRKRRPKSSWNCSHYKEHEQTPLIHPNKVIHGVPLEPTFPLDFNLSVGHVWSDAIVNVGWKIDPYSSLSLDARDIYTHVSDRFIFLVIKRIQFHTLELFIKSRF